MTTSTEEDTPHPESGDELPPPKWLDDTVGIRTASQNSNLDLPEGIPVVSIGNPDDPTQFITSNVWFDIDGTDHYHFK